MEFDTAHRALASQHELILTSDLRAAGMDDAGVRATIAHLPRIRRGAYATTQPRDEVARHRLQAKAVMLRRQGNLAVSHVSAAAMHGVAIYDVDLSKVHVTYLSGCQRRGGRHGVQSHETPSLDVSDAVDIEGFPVTSVPRTVVDCARLLPLEPALVMADHALHERWTTKEDLVRRVEQTAGFGGVGSARQVLRLMDGRSESPGETRTRLILARARIPAEPQVNITAEDGSFVARVDFLLGLAPVVVEFDGRKKYSERDDPEAAHWNDKLRTDAILHQGFTLVRLTWEDLANPAAVVSRVRAAITRTQRERG